MAGRIFGHVPGYPEGSLFENRAELSESRVHVPIQAGIAGSQTEGAESIVLSGGYEDDFDDGDEIFYTGQGGRDPRTGQQTHDQPFSRGNRALALNRQNGLPVRVIRGSNHDSPHSPPHGYSYDGLYTVKEVWHGPGKSGFQVWRFRMVKIPDGLTTGHEVREERGNEWIGDREGPVTGEEDQSPLQEPLPDMRYPPGMPCGALFGGCACTPARDPARRSGHGREYPVPVPEPPRAVRQRCHLYRGRSIAYRDRLRRPNRP